MPRPEKVEAVEKIKELISGSSGVFLSEYRGLSVPQQQKLRNSLREVGASYKVVKMSLARIAAQELGHDEFAKQMVGPTAVAFAGDDAAAAAKALAEFAKEHDVFVLKAGLLGTDFMAPEKVGELAKLPSRDVLLAKIAGAVQAPMVKLAGMLSSFTRDMAGMMSQLLEKKEAQDPESGSDGAEEISVEATEEASTTQEVTEEVVEEVAEAASEEAPEAPEASEEAADEAATEEAPAKQDTETAEDQPDAAEKAEEE